MNERHRQVKVTVEDLIQLKRAERAPPEFWVQFEQQLRAKQLAAIVAKKPWWQSLSLSRWRGGMARLSLPVGATAVLALTFLAVREQGGERSGGTEIEPVAAPRTVVADSQPVSSEPLMAAPAMASVATSQVELETAAESTVTESPAVNRSRVSELLAWGRDNGPAMDAAELLPGTHSVAANLALTQTADADLTQVLPRSRAYDRQVAHAARTTTPDPLTTVATPSDTRRARLLAALVEEDAYSVQMSSSRSRERITSRLTEQALYESVSRLSAGGDRLSIKF